MPYLFLSPSTQEYNPYINYGTEESWMNALADAMEPLLRASGINVTRNDPEKTVTNSIRMSNAGNYDFHLALHSNAAPEALAGKLRGIDIYHYPGREEALRMARILKENLEFLPFFAVHIVFQHHAASMDILIVFPIIGMKF